MKQLTSRKNKAAAFALHTFRAAAIAAFALLPCTRTQAQLDVTSVLLSEAVDKPVQKAAETGQKPQVEVQAREPRNTLPEYFSPDSNSLRLSIANLESVFEKQTESAFQESFQLNRKAKEELIKTNISSFAPDENDINKKKLNNLIKQLNSMQFPPTREEQQPREEKTEPEIQPDRTKAKDTNTPAEPNEPNKTTGRPKTKEQKTQSEDALSPRTLKQIEEIRKRSLKVPNPKLLAELLFAGGYYEHAAWFFEAAIDDKDENLTDADKAWLLMQQAVCLRHCEPDKAVRVYERLIKEYPSSNWIPLAKENQTLLQWMQNQQPEKLVEQCRKELKQNK